MLMPSFIIHEKILVELIAALSTGHSTMLSVENIFARAKNCFGRSAAFYVAANPSTVAIDSGIIF